MKNKRHVRFCYPFVAILFILMAGKVSAIKVTVFEYGSKYYKIQLVDTVPFVKYFSADGEGNHELGHNIIQWKGLSGAAGYELHKISDHEAELCKKGAPGHPEWVFKFEELRFSATSLFQNGDTPCGIDFRFDKHENHATLLGLMSGKNMTRLPAILHFPDMGSFRLEADKQAVSVAYDACRKKGTNYISIVLPAADAAKGRVRYTFTAKSVYPRIPHVNEERFSGFRRNYLNLFQINPRLQVIANNSASDPCAFTLFLSSMLALRTPPLARSLTALDLLRMSVEQYLNGMKAYGMDGYSNDWESGGNAKTAPPKRDTYLDTYPSLVISACNYIKGSNDKRWAEHYYPKIKEWMDSQMVRDRDNNGLVEFERSGNSGSWDGQQRPANWWDTIGYGHEDAFSNAITYDALNLMVMVAGKLNNKEDAEIYRRYAEKLKASYFKTFFNPGTGVLAGWKSKDGKLHDYYFLVVNSMAVYYNLVPEDKIKGLMTTLWNKMRDVGFTNFRLGLPGNLVSVRRDDYTHHDPRWGGGLKEDGSDAFQRYENGGASLNWSYFSLKAFKRAGMAGELKLITDGILDAINKGDFQGFSGTMARDWKTWNGECWGYEGFLCDGYLVLLALNPDDN